MAKKVNKYSTISIEEIQKLAEINASGSMWAVYVFLCSYSRSYGVKQYQAFPSQKTISLATKLPLRTIQYSLKRLQAGQIIERQDSNTGRLSKTIHLTFRRKSDTRKMLRLPPAKIGGHEDYKEEDYSLFIKQPIGLIEKPEKTLRLSGTDISNVFPIWLHSFHQHHRDPVKYPYPKPPEDPSDLFAWIVRGKPIPLGLSYLDIQKLLFS